MSTEWLLFLPQIPSSPSSLRVLVWRRMRAVGATGLQNGVWVLPRRPEHERFLRELISEIEPQGGRGLIFIATSMTEEMAQSIIEHFRIDRDQEYAELCERCAEFLHEIEKETARQKFTFAELEENEDDLHKLTGWLDKIQARDFFKGHQADTAVAVLSRCRQVLDDFTQIVYSRQGLNALDDDNLDEMDTTEKS